ncbi:MAG: hypothetical protein PHD81_02010 [Candidatus Nanoarchaeia archaeon]|nr:hypothetical protein [Candidatus Nanoarchaeia archaeon]MDD5587864.1 hypothetical protein [Candidatus Nanoarchaeia archaeon]
MEKLTTSIFGKRLPNLIINIKVISHLPYTDKDSLLGPTMMALDELYEKVCLVPIKNKKDELSEFRAICFNSKIKVVKEQSTPVVVIVFIKGVLINLSNQLNYKINIINYKEADDLAYEMAQGSMLIHK